MSGVDLPPAVASLIEMLANEMVDDAAAGARDDARLACWMIEATRPWPAAAEETLLALCAAHRDGETRPALWRSLRGAAVGMGDSVDPDLRRFGAVAEAAAWPLASSRAGLVELMRAVCQVRAMQASRATGWTSEDEVDAIAKLTRIAEGDGSHVPRREEIPDLFAAAYPALGRRFAQQLGAANTSFLSFRREVAAWLMGAGRS